MKYNSRFNVGSHCLCDYDYSLSDGNVSVQNDLAITPAQMLRMTEQGIPVTPANMSASAQLFEGTPTESWVIPADMLRGADMADAWNAQQDARRSVYKAHETDMADKVKNPINPINS